MSILNPHYHLLPLINSLSPLGLSLSLSPLPPPKNFALKQFKILQPVPLPLMYTLALVMYVHTVMGEEKKTGFGRVFVEGGGERMLLLKGYDGLDDRSHPHLPPSTPTYTPTPLQIPTARLSSIEKHSISH